MIYYLASLSAAFCWACGGVLSKSAINQVGAMRFNRYRISFVFVILAVTGFFIDDWQPFLNFRIATLLLLSGFVGIFMGDSFLFLTMQRMGPRRTMILFSTNAIMTVFFSLLFLDERWGIINLTGIILVIAGVFAAVVYGNNKQNTHLWDQTQGKPIIGICLGLFAALCQSLGILLSKPVMQEEVNPFVAQIFRVGIAMMFFHLARPYEPKATANVKIDLKIFSLIGSSGIFGMYLGMAFLMFGLIGGNPGIVSTLSATTPVMVLPLLWIITKKPPTFLAWIGAIITAIGTMMIFTGGLLF